MLTITFLCLLKQVRVSQKGQSTEEINNKKKEEEEKDESYGECALFVTKSCVCVWAKWIYASSSFSIVFYGVRFLSLSHQLAQEKYT